MANLLFDKLASVIKPVPYDREHGHVRPFHRFIDARRRRRDPRDPRQRGDEMKRMGNHFRGFGRRPANDKKEAL
jgi:hypothetical protein